eukprot:10473047-Lingulodinium_polyedra.AAC.1
MHSGDQRVHLRGRHPEAGPANIGVCPMPTRQWLADTAGLPADPPHKEGRRPSCEVFKYAGGEPCAFGARARSVEGHREVRARRGRD